MRVCRNFWFHFFSLWLMAPWPWFRVLLAELKSVVQMLFLVYFYRHDS